MQVDLSNDGASTNGKIIPYFSPTLNRKKNNAEYFRGTDYGLNVDMQT